jgi:TonB family protein
MTHAQQSCGANVISTSVSKLVYPAIAKAAHLTGAVVLLVAFKHDGSVENVRVLSGPPMLQGSAIDFVKGWKADTSEGSRECPVVVSFLLDDCGHLLRSTNQHAFVCAETIVLSDPEMTVTAIKRRKHFLLS